MHDQWTYSSNFLPYTGEPIEFRLEEREQPIHGTFADGVFHSRWADYGAGRVASWRGSDADPSTAPVPIPLVETHTVIASLKRLVHVFSRGRNADPTKPPRIRFKTTEVSATPMPSTANTDRYIDSNRISS